MVSTSLASSRSNFSSASQTSLSYVPPSPSSSNHSASSSKLSLDQQDEGIRSYPISRDKHLIHLRKYHNYTLTNKEDWETTEPRVRRVFALGSNSMIEYTSRDLRLLAVSTHMTELSYAISDIQTRIFGESRVQRFKTP